MPSYPNVNGLDPSWSSIEIKIGQERFYGITSINYDDSLTPGRTGGLGTIPLGSTAGTWDGSASMEMNRNDADLFLSRLGDGFGRVIFSITVQYAEDGMPTVTDILPAVRVSKPSHSNSQGSEATKVSFDLFLMKPIERNGLRIERGLDLSGAAV